MAADSFPKPEVVLSQSSKFATQIDFHLLKQMPSLNLNPEVHFRLYAAILKNRYDVITPPPICTKFGKQMYNGMAMSIYTAKAKPEIELKYGGRPFPENGRSFISAVN